MMCLYMTTDAEEHLAKMRRHLPAQLPALNGKKLKFLMKVSIKETDKRHFLVPIALFRAPVRTNNLKIWRHHNIHYRRKYQTANAKP